MDDQSNAYELRYEAPADRPTLDGILYPEIPARIEGARRAKARYEAWLARVTPQLEALEERQRLRALDEDMASWADPVVQARSGTSISRSESGPASAQGWELLATDRRHGDIHDARCDAEVEERKGAGTGEEEVIHGQTDHL